MDKHETTTVIGIDEPASSDEFANPETSETATRHSTNLQELSPVAAQARSHFGRTHRPRVPNIDELNLIKWQCLGGIVDSIEPLVSTSRHTTTGQRFRTVQWRPGSVGRLQALHLVI